METRINARLQNVITTELNRQVGGSRDQINVLCIKILLVVNGIWVILRAFVRNLSAIIHPDGITILDYIHQYRYAIQTIVDLVNGLLILYCLYQVTQIA